MYMKNSVYNDSNYSNFTIKSEWMNISLNYKSTVFWINHIKHTHKDGEWHLFQIRQNSILTSTELPWLYFNKQVTNWTHANLIKCNNTLLLFLRNAAVKVPSQREKYILL
jgi:hypothetical protein